ncbi:MAG: polymer-forming cytoskeletal protein [Alphaproteobacteria bacterium]
MFSKADTPVEKLSPSSSRTKVPSIVAENLHIVGNLQSDGDIQVEGIVDGDISTNKLTVGSGATVNGAIIGDEITISGTVNGQITARAIRLTRTAKVVGDINHDSLSIEAGAFVQGLCKRIDPGKNPAGKQVSGLPETAAIPGKVVPVSS